MMTRANKLDVNDMMKCPICDFPLVISDDNFFCKTHGNKDGILNACFKIIEEATTLKDIKKEVIGFMQMIFANRLSFVGDRISKQIGNGLKMLKNFAYKLQNIDSVKRDDSGLF